LAGFLLADAGDDGAGFEGEVVGAGAEEGGGEGGGVVADDVDDPVAADPEGEEGEGEEGGEEGKGACEAVHGCMVTRKRRET
jgi:hypothetical protein